MEFSPLYHGDLLRVINLSGDVGVVTLWSKPDSTCNVLESAGVDLSAASRIAVVANLYGNGLPHMLRNLLYNPQIQYIVICGKNLSGSREWFLNFFKEGLEETESLGVKVFRIKGTDRVIDGEVRPEHFTSPPKFKVFGDIGDSETKAGFKDYFDSLPPQEEVKQERFNPPAIPEPVVSRFPANALGQTIVRDTPMEAWRELVFRLHRFGHRNTVRKSSGPQTRIELLNVHVVIEKPQEESSEVLKSHGFSLDHFREYAVRILDPVKPSDLVYTYGNLLRSGLGSDPVDSVQIIADRLKAYPESRHAYATLWNNGVHLPNGKGCPCFVTLFFRKFENQLTMTATFRVHNAMDAWPENVYGLMAIQRFVAERASLPVGPITLISHSISIDPSELPRAVRVVGEKETDNVVDQATGKQELRFDPNGSFTVTVDSSKKEIVVEHSYNGMRLGEYRGKTAEELENALARDNAISLISHALYLGREIYKKEAELKRAKEKAS